MMSTNDLRTALTIGRMGLDNVATLVDLSARKGVATVKPLSPDLAAETRVVAARIGGQLGLTIDVIEA